MKDIYKEAFMDMAVRFGQTSYAERLKVGCLLVKNGSIISEGVNGQPPVYMSTTILLNLSKHQLILDM